MNKFTPDIPETVGALIAWLQQYPSNLQVLIWGEIGLCNVYAIEHEEDGNQPAFIVLEPSDGAE